MIKVGSRVLVDRQREGKVVQTFPREEGGRKVKMYRVRLNGGGDAALRTLDLDASRIRELP
jgi:hypothetical protein